MELSQLTLAALPHIPLVRAGGAPAHTAGRQGHEDNRGNLQDMAVSIAQVVLERVAVEALTSWHASQLEGGRFISG